MSSSSVNKSSILLKVMPLPSIIENNTVSAILNTSTINTVAHIFNISMLIDLRLDEMRVSLIMLLSKNRQSSLFFISSDSATNSSVQNIRIP